jgi:hypothetical protein
MAATARRDVGIDAFPQGAQHNPALSKVSDGAGGSGNGAAKSVDCGPDHGVTRAGVVEHRGHAGAGNLTEPQSISVARRWLRFTTPAAHQARPKVRAGKVAAAPSSIYQFGLIVVRPWFFKLIRLTAIVSKCAHFSSITINRVLHGSMRRPASRAVTEPS